MQITIVGAGLAGLTAGRLLKDAGHNIKIFETRDYIGGNCADFYTDDNVLYHPHGSHIFNTDHKRVFDFFRNYAGWKPTRTEIKADTVHGRIPIPFNLHSIGIVGVRMRLESMFMKLIQVRCGESPFLIFPHIFKIEYLLKDLTGITNILIKLMRDCQK